MNPELIERFFRKQCTAQEAKKIAAYLKANPSVLEKYLSTFEWNSLVENGMPEEFWNEVWDNIQQKNKAKLISLKLKRVAAAACIILLAGAAFFYFKPVNQKTQPFVAQHVNISPQIRHESVINNTKKIMTVVLEDNSVIKLTPASSVQYDVPFPDTKREIVLEGEAEFHVAKNKQKPFTVFTGALATTALGTVFNIKKTAVKNIVTIKLLQGKIVIHSTTDYLKGWKQDVYLQAGEELKYNESTAILAIKNINENKVSNLPKVEEQPTNSLGDHLTFSNSPLTEVMNKLSAYYNVKIQYDSRLIDIINFTGTISRNDSLPVILNVITQMNDLQISKNDSAGFIISKHE